MSNIVGATKFKIKNTKLYVPIVTLSSQDNAKLVKQLVEGFNWPVSGRISNKNRNIKFRREQFYKIFS